MKLLRYVAGDEIRPGIIDASGSIRDLGGVVPDIDSEAISPEGLTLLAAIDPESLPRVKGSRQPHDLARDIGLLDNARHLAGALARIAGKGRFDVAGPGKGT